MVKCIDICMDVYVGNIYSGKGCSTPLQNRKDGLASLRTSERGHFEEKDGAVTPL